MAAEYHDTARHCGGAARVTYSEVALAWGGSWIIPSIVIELDYTSII